MTTTMNTKIEARDLAVALCHRSTCRTKMAAVCVDAHGVFAWGWNHAGPAGFGTHAEEHALHRANRRRLVGCTIVVAGLRHGALRSRTRRFVYAKPCADRCWPRLVAAGVRRVEFVTPGGAWIDLSIVSARSAGQAA